MNESAEEDLVYVNMESSVFSQVVFIDVPHSFPLQTDVTCCYKMTGGLIPSPKDWIGIYKVSWDSIHKYYCYEWVKICLDYNGLDPLEQQVIFKECHLPKDDGEFYQFCYVDSNGKVRGASTPFCFQNPAESSEDCSLLVISTQEQVEQVEKEKKALETKAEQLTEENAILKNELNERLQEICRLRMYNEELKSYSVNETFPLNKPPETAEQASLEQSSFSDLVAETKHDNEKYEKAVKKINSLKQENVQLKQQLKEKDTLISELKSKTKILEQDNNGLQDQCRLQQIDVQSMQKERDRLYAENEGNKREQERALEENKALKEMLFKHGPSEGDKSDTKIQMLTSELADVRGEWRKETLKSSEAVKRADKAELELADLKMQIEKKTEKSQIETEHSEACRRISIQANTDEVAQLEKEMLSEENKKLKDDIERLKMMVYDLSSGNVTNIQQQQNPRSPVPASPVNTQQQPQSDLYFYEDISGPSGNPAGNKVCCHCQESFPDITEEELEKHEQSHKVCPFCTLICDDFGQQAFEDHVYSHED